MRAADETAEIERITAVSVATLATTGAGASRTIRFPRLDSACGSAAGKPSSRASAIAAATPARLAREVAVAGYVTARGGPAVSPTTMVPPGPYWQDGLAVTLWEYVPPSPLRPAPAEAGAALARLHHAAAGCRADPGYLTPARDLIADGLSALERDDVLDPATFDALRTRHARVLSGLAASGPTIVLHGDAYPGNLLAADGGWRWVDLGETCKGPAEWDLAVLAGQSGAGADAALRGYADLAGCALPSTASLAPFTRARRLEAAVWTIGMAHRYPARYLDIARELLAAALSD